MSDEIDIEEHDVMDNPCIKRIFPDLSVIKKEINQYYDEAIIAPAEISNEGSGQEEAAISVSAIIAPAEISNEESGQEEATISVSGARLYTNIQNSDDSVSTRTSNISEDTSAKKDSRIYENIIILGSKPNAESVEINSTNTRKQPKIVLKNVSPFLKRCKRYCRECLILFPNQYAFNVHLSREHIEQINDKTNKVMMFMGSKLNDKLFECNICNKPLSNQANLARHFKNIHRDIKTLKFIDTSSRKMVSKDVSVNKESKKPSCFHCQQIFPTQNSLIEHLYEVLEPSKSTDQKGSKSPLSEKETNNEANDPVKNEGTKVYECKNFECSDFKLKLDSLEKMEKHYKENHINKTNSVHPNINNESTYKDDSVSKLRRKFSRRKASESSDISKGEDNIIKKKRKTRSTHTQKEQTRDNIRLRQKRSIEYNEQFHTKKELEVHTTSVHIRKKQLIKTNKIKSKSSGTNGKLNSHQKVPPTVFYRCFICSRYNITFKYYSRHLKIDHKIEKVTKVKKEPFDSKCRFCPSKLYSFNSYNTHINRFHKKLLKQAYSPREMEVNTIRVESFGQVQYALKTILYKCTKCELFFLSCNAAMDHAKHLKNTSNWRCSVCQRLFRSEDMNLHIKQHKFSATLTVYSLTESEFSRVLYKCINCTIHYSEENFLLHYPTCESETPNSLYCKFCDFLINRDDMEFHELNHKAKKMLCSDFTIIESDMIDYKPNKDEKTEGLIKRNRNTNGNSEEISKLAMTFCDTCKCFVNMNMISNVHIEAKCGHMLKTVCKECGLVMTNKIHQTHKEHHKKKQIVLQDYVFFDFYSKKRISPPIPDYPKCNACGVHFLRNSAITFHECQEQEYIACNICSIKLTEHAYKLHMAFHNYELQKVNKTVEETYLDSNPDNDLTVSLNSHDINELNIDDNIKFYYTCKSCQITVDTYDKVVQHCHDHYDIKVIKLNRHKCQNCIFTFQFGDFQSHNILHMNGKYNKDLIEVVEYDPFYLRYDNDFWIKHIFAYVADEKMNKILSNSIYKYECKIKMEEIQSGSSSLTFYYKCGKCMVFIDPNYLFTHALHSRDKSCVHARKYPCAVCGLSFASSVHRMSHEKEHEGVIVNVKKYKIILFNKVEHNPFNKMMYDACSRYTLYECRNCEGVVDKFERNGHTCDVNNLKICSFCGLLIHNQDYDLHFVRHEELDKFIVENITVVMFGKECNRRNKELKSTFCGTKYDHTVYKCENCNLCLSTKNYQAEHVCVPDNSKCKCAECCLYFSKEELKSHSKLHESNSGFDLLNLNIITFDTSSKNLESKETLSENNDLQQTEKSNKKDSVAEENTNNSSKKLERIYKCDCGLHFLEESNAQQHAKNCNIKMKISRQSCFKCDLLFTPGELFNHLLKHHGDKKLKLQFDVVLVCKQDNK